jgi:beta-glucanase (GH16 family)
MPAILTPPSGFASVDLVFEDRFCGTRLNTNKWNTYATSAAAKGRAWHARPNGGSGLGDRHNAEYFMPYQVTVNNGLSLTAVKRPVAGHPSTVPYTSGVVSSYGHLDFVGGYLQISMQAPPGGGSWPALWLMPGKGGTSGDHFEIDIQEGGFTSGSANPNNVFAWHLHTPSGVFGGTVDTTVDLTAHHHTYAINWLPAKSITWYFDGRQISQLTSAQAQIPDEPMQLMMNQSVANSATAEWHTTAGAGTPRSMTMHIEGVQLYQKAGLGDSATIKSPAVGNSGNCSKAGGTASPPTRGPNRLEKNARSNGMIVHGLLAGAWRRLQPGLRRVRRVMSL